MTSPCSPVTGRTRPGQLVLAVNSSSDGQILLPLGAKITVASTPGHPVLTVVGEADLGHQFGGRLGGAGRDRPAARRRGRPAARRCCTGSAAPAAPRPSARMPPRSARRCRPGAVTAVQSYLTVREQETSQIGPFVPFLVAFGVIGLVMSVLIVANVVSGAVVAGYRRIGILKSIGFTPGQVVAAYTAQVAVPALAGVLGGLVARRPAGHDAAAPGRERLRRGPAQRPGLGGRGRARGHARPGRRSRPCCRRCGRRRLSAVQAIARGPGAAAGPRLRRAPAAAAAARCPGR